MPGLPWAALSVAVSGATTAVCVCLAAVSEWLSFALVCSAISRVWPPLQLDRRTGMEHQKQYCNAVTSHRY